MATRVTHTVRCRNPKNSRQFVDVEVLDALTVMAANGQSILYWVRAKDSDLGASRVTHFVTVTNPNDVTQTLDVEVLDGFALQPPITSDANSDVTAINLNAGGATPNNGGAPIALLMRDVRSSSTLIVDKTGLGLGQTPAEATRSGHVNVVTTAGATDDGAAMPDTDSGADWLTTIITDAIAFQGPNGQESVLLVPKSAQDAHDTTQTVADPDTGEQVPPDNDDPQEYVRFPDNSMGQNLGANPTGGPISQGILWHIKNISQSQNSPWYWWIPLQQPLAFSYFGHYHGGGWALLPNIAEVVILPASTFVRLPVDPFGSPTLEYAIDHWLGGFQGVDTGVQPDGVSPGAWGKIDLSPTQQLAPGSIGVPTIWQSVGIDQPLNPDGSPAFVNPGSDIARTVVTTWVNMWNDTSNACNDYIQTLQGQSDSDARLSYPPVWPWARPQPWHSSFDHVYENAFQGGITTALFNPGITLAALQPATSTIMAVGQLDTTIWDTTQFPPVRWGQAPPGAPPPYEGPPAIQWLGYDGAGGLF